MGVVCVVAIFCVITQILPYSVIRPGRLTSQDIARLFPGDPTPSGVGLKYDRFDVAVGEGIVLRGWFVFSQTQPAQGTIFVLHGIGSCRVAMIPMAKVLAENGFNCVLYDSRANGDSGGANCTFGYYEKRDLSAFIDAVEKRFPNGGPLGVFGNSLGAAVSIQAMGCDKRIACGVVESPFATLREVVHDYSRRTLIVPMPIVSDMALKRAEQIAKFKVDDVKPEVSALSIIQPVMIVHGLKDAHIRSDYGRRVFDHVGATDKVWYPIAEGTHYNLAEVGGQVYQDTVVQFFKKHLH